MPTCIYCRRFERERFPREHVIPKSLGTFYHNLTVRCVCRDCNHYFSKHLELQLARESAESIVRFQYGLRDGKAAEPRSKITATVNVPGPMLGAKVVLGPNSTGNGFEIFYLPQVAIHATGERAPTVLFESGMGASCLSWTYVQPAVAEFSRAVSYDRAGHGWSDPAHGPRTAQQIAQELHALLDATGVPGPYVLVGHSFGGYVTRAFARLYREEVVGMVLVDSIHPAEWERPSRRAECKSWRVKAATGFILTAPSW
jgi:hypothetical protein